MQTIIAAAAAVLGAHMVHRLCGIDKADMQDDSQAPVLWRLWQACTFVIRQFS